MMRLVLSELKKIFKNKFNILMIVLLLGFYAFSAINALNDGFYRLQQSGYPDDFVLETFEGEKLDSAKKIYAYIDEVLSKYEGKDPEKMWELFKKDYEMLAQKYTSEYDKQKMEAKYGSDWQGILERNQSGTLTKQDIKILENTVEDWNYNQEYNRYNLQHFFKEEAKLATLNLIYHRVIYNYYSQDKITLTISDEGVVNAGETYHYPLYLFSHTDEYLAFLKSGSALQYDTSAKTTNLSKYVEEHFDDYDLSFHSNVSMTVLYDAYNQNLIFTLIVLAIICANTFAQEKSTKMDQLIVPTREGEIKICIAKFLANLVMCIGITALIVLLLTAIACVYILPNGWNNVVYLFGYWTNYGYPYLTFLQYFLVMFQMWILGAIVISGLVSFLSYFTKNRFITIIIMFAFVVAPIAMQEVIPSWLLCMTPFGFYEEYNMLTSNHLINDPMVAPGFWFKDVISIIWILIVLILLMMMLLKAKRHYVENK